MALPRRDRVPSLSLLFAATAALGGCVDDGTELTLDDQEIRGGTTVPDGRHEAVVRVLRDDGAYCSGTLITPSTVLTAAHCICDDDACTATDFQHTFDVEFTDVLPVGGTTRADQTFPVRSFQIHPDYRPGRDVQWANDYAILRLDQATSVSSHQEVDDVIQVTPVTVRRSELPVGDGATLVGYGRYGTDCANLGNGVKREVDVTLDRYITYSAPNGKTMEFEDDDHGTCKGDSGGAVLDGQGRLAGVHSTADQDTISRSDPTSNAYEFLTTYACPFFDAGDPDTGFASELCPGATGEGDCDSDAQCVAGAVCAENVGKVAGLPSYWDVCWDTDHLARAYAATSYGGVVQELPPGTWTASELSIVGDNGISSLRVPAGLTVRLCDGAGGGAPCQDFTTSVATLPAGFDNTASQVTVDVGVRGYASASYAGSALTFRAGTYQGSQLGALLTSLRSLRAFPGVNLRVCTGLGATGTCRELWGDVATVPGEVAGARYLAVRPGATVYEHADYQGASQAFAPGTYSSLAGFTAIANDTVSSIVVAPGHSATLCSHASGVGPCRTFAAGHHAFVGLTMNDATSWLRVD